MLQLFMSQQDVAARHKTRHKMLKAGLRTRFSRKISFFAAFRRDLAARTTYNRCVLRYAAIFLLL
jgi:hypothetical protein